MFLLVLKKFGLALLNIVAFFVGIFLWALTLYPFNFPYLLKLPQEADYVIAIVFALTFVCIAVVMVRTKWCFENDLFFAKKDEKAPPLVWRIVSSQEFIADVIVFAVMVLGLFTWTAATSDAPWYRAVPTVALIVVGGTIVFAALDCLLYVIARKKADKRLRKREEK
ncbi:MAG: hypothetical protein IJN04_01785 [Clostridia bacterium]|nr:hypothetical protein [Clostridia bacterium]